MDERDSGKLADAMVYAAQVLADTNERIAKSARAAEAQNTKIQTRLAWLTVVLAAGALLQALATAWPYIGWWLTHKNTH